MIHHGQWLVKVKIAMPCREKFIFFPNNLFPSDPMYKGVLMHFVHAHKKTKHWLVIHTMHSAIYEISVHIFLYNLIHVHVQCERCLFDGHATF